MTDHQFDGSGFEKHRQNCGHGYKRELPGSLRPSWIRRVLGKLGSWFMRAARKNPNARPWR